MSTCIFTQLLRTSSKNTNMALLFTLHLHVLGWMSSHGLSAVWQIGYFFIRLDFWVVGNCTVVVDLRSRASLVGECKAGGWS